MNCSVKHINGHPWPMLPSANNSNYAYRQRFYEDSQEAQFKIKDFRDRWWVQGERYWVLGTRFRVVLCFYPKNNLVPST